IGGTPENPFFDVNSPLVSRSQIFQFQPISEEDIRKLIDRAIKDPEHGYGKLKIDIAPEAIQLWETMSDGDARRALMALEVAVLSQLSDRSNSGLGVSPEQSRLEPQTRGQDAHATEKQTVHITLAQAAIYMATAPKSNASYLAINKAMTDVREGRTIPVPVHLRDTHYQGSKRLGHGEGYQYPHDFEGAVIGQDYLGVDVIYYTPTDRGYEAQIKRRLDEWRKRIQRADPSQGPDEADAGNEPS